MGEGKSNDVVQEKDENAPQEIVVKVDMHCEACARKVARALTGFPGVEEVLADYSSSGRVMVKGKMAAADPTKVAERVRKKTGRKVEIISPLPEPNQNNKQEEPEPPKEDKKDDKKPPAATTVVLKVRMHCEPCAHTLHKCIRKLKGVESVTTDIANSEVIVQGVIHPEKLVCEVYMRTGKQAFIVKKDEENMKNEKQEETKVGEERKVEEGEKKITDEVVIIKKSEYLPLKYCMDYAYGYPPQIFSDENPNAYCSLM